MSDDLVVVDERRAAPAPRERDPHTATISTPRGEVCTPSGDHAAHIASLIHPACRRPDDVWPFRAHATCPTTLVVGGDVDLASAPALREALADPAVVVVDMAAVTFIDAAGLGVLIEAHRRHRAGLTLRVPSAIVRRLLALTGHLDTFAIIECRARPEVGSRRRCSPGSATRRWLIGRS